mmetsp:Transcript_16318/g.46343  ORF Transcript_16318/g.46343 Transcript_16318/m.46343 type:complete len:220 (-) Transcript_16318:1186-1845(-)
MNALLAFSARNCRPWTSFDAFFSARRNWSAATMMACCVAKNSMRRLANCSSAVALSRGTARKGPNGSGTDATLNFFECLTCTSRSPAGTTIVASCKLASRAAKPSAAGLGRRASSSATISRACASPALSRNTSRSSTSARAKSTAAASTSCAARSEISFASPSLELPATSSGSRRGMGSPRLATCVRSASAASSLAFRCRASSASSSAASATRALALSS